MVLKSAFFASAHYEKKPFILLSSILALVIISGIWYYDRPFNSANPVHRGKSWSSDRPAALKLENYVQQLKAYVARSQYNEEVGLLADMSIESGKARLFVVNLEKDSIEAASLVTHGRCNEKWLNGRKYSNTPGSGCTSLGRYKIGYSYQGKFGLAYKLFGLDSSNNNAFKRFVVLHAHECVPEQPPFPLPICQSDGCPTVSPAFLQKLKVRINASPKPIVLWIYE